MNRAMNLSNITCQYQNHKQRKIITICLNTQCQSNRLCCLQCLGEFHSLHPEDLIEIDSLNSFIQQEYNRQVQFPESHTNNQYQLILGFEELLKLVNSFQKLIKKEIETLKNFNFQEYLIQYSDNQGGTQHWNQFIEGMLQFIDVENCNPILRNQSSVDIMEQARIQKINEAKESLQQIIKKLDKSDQNNQLKFQQDPIYLEGHKKEVNEVVISSDGQIIASGSDDKTVKLWNAKTQQFIHSFPYTDTVYGGVALSFDKRYLAFGGDGDYSIQLYDLMDNSNFGPLIGHEDIIYNIVFSRVGKLLFSGGCDNKIIIWNLNLMLQIHSFQTDSKIRKIIVSPDNKLVSCACEESINIWDYSKKTQLIHSKDPHSITYGLCSSKDSSVFVSSGRDGVIKIWSLNNSDKNKKQLTVTKKINAADKAIYKVILTSDEQYIISICNQKMKIMIHEIQSGNQIQQLLFGIGNGISSLGYISISDDMNVLVSGGEDKMVKIWMRE